MDTTNPYETHATNDVEIVRLFGQPDAPKHYAVPVAGQPHHYRLLCSGHVIDAMAHGGALEHPTCRACQRMDDPMDVETACYRVAQELGYRGNGGGWIYGPNATAKSRAITQGWGNFATIMSSRFSGRGLILRNANGTGWYVDREALAAVVARQQVAA